jgi:hypothetical protein
VFTRTKHQIARIGINRATRKALKNAEVLATETRRQLALTAKTARKEDRKTALTANLPPTRLARTELRASQLASTAQSLAATAGAVVAIRAAWKEARGQLPDPAATDG